MEKTLNEYLTELNDYIADMNRRFIELEKRVKNDRLVALISDHFDDMSVVSLGTEENYPKVDAIECQLCHGTIRPGDLIRNAVLLKKDSVTEGSAIYTTTSLHSNCIRNYEGTENMVNRLDFSGERGLKYKQASDTSD